MGGDLFGAAPIFHIASGFEVVGVGLHVFARSDTQGDGNESLDLTERFVRRGYVPLLFSNFSTV
jgi:hypothetical protein